MCLFPVIVFALECPVRKFSKVFQNEIHGAFRFISWLCERAFRSRFTLREEGQVELLGRRPTDLTPMQWCPSQRDGVNANFYEIERR